MNLNYDLSTEALKQLVAKADQKIPVHNIAVDYDGEVLIDPELYYPQVDIKRYKFWARIQNASLRNFRNLQALHAILINEFNPQLGGNEMRIAA